MLDPWYAAPTNDGKNEDTNRGNDPRCDEVNHQPETVKKSPTFEKVMAVKHEMMRRQAFLTGLTSPPMKPGANSLANANAVLEAFDKKFPNPIEF